MKKSALRIIGLGIVSLLLSTAIKSQTVVVDTIEYQNIRGFGGINMPGWINDLTSDQVDKAFGNGPGQIGMSILRVRVPYNNAAFNLEVPTAVHAKSLGAIVFASPWTPPAIMKSNNSIIGGYLNPSYYEEYANHLDSFANYMNTYGASLYAISVQNEPDVPSVNYESCDWSPTQMLNFVLEQGSKFTDTKLIVSESYIFDHGMTDAILDSSTAEPLVDIIGGHIYGGGLTDYPLSRSKGKEIWMTEHYTESAHSANDWPLALDVGTEIHNCMKANFNAYIWWYIRRSYGMIDESGNVSKRGYVLSQFSKFVRPGYARVGTTVSSAPNVYVTAYATDTTLVIVAVNNNSTATNLDFTIQDNSVDSLIRYTTSATKNLVNDGGFHIASNTFSTSLDAQSIATFISYKPFEGSDSNLVPIANAGSDQEVTDTDNNGTETITFVGSASSDTDGTISNYSWAEGGYQIAWGESPSVEMETGIHEVILTVTDNEGATDKDTVIITVNMNSNIAEVHIWMEAECGTVGPTWNTLADVTASNELYVIVKPGNNSAASASENADDQVSYSIEITEPGNYKLWGRARVPSADDDSYWVRMDNESWIKWNSISGGSSWQWDDVHNSDNGGQAVSYNLAAGNHILTIAYREDGAALDKFYLTNTGTTPSNLGDDATNCPIIPNVPPVANAGSDQTVTDTDNDEIEQITLNGSTSTDSDGSITSYIWNEDGSEIANSVSQPVNMTIGTHIVVLTVTDDQGATDIDSVTVTVNAAVNDLKTMTKSDNSIIIYPNPVKDVLSISVKELSNNISDFYIYNETGLLIKTISLEKELTLVDLNNMPGGLYFIKVIVDNETVVQKFIKK